MSLDDSRSAAFALRYGEGAPEVRHEPPHEPPLWNATIAQLLAHRTVRAYRGDALPEGLVETLVAAAQSAASSSNLQLWSVVAITDAGQRARLSDVTGGQKHVAQAPLVLLWVADLARATLVAKDADAPVAGLDYLESFTVAAVDAGIAAQNAVIAAESLGLGTCYLSALRNHPEEVAAIAGLPERAVVVFGMTVGWPDEAHPAAVKPRLPQSVVRHDGKYRLEEQLAGIAAYDEVAKAFQAREGQEVVGWRALLLARARNAAALNGRDRLKAALRALGFALK